MKNNSKFSVPLIMLFLASSCAIFERQDEQAQSVSWPTWVNSPQSSQEIDCQQMFLCAVGEGERLSSAQAQSRAELAKIFRVEVVQDSQYEQWAAMSERAQGQTGEHFYQQLNQLTQEVLEGVEVAKSFHAQGRFFALATLNKMQARRKFSALLDQKDQELIRLKSLNSRRTLVEARSLWLQREEIHQRMQVLSHFREAPISLVDIERSIEALPKTEVWLNWRTDMNSAIDGHINAQLHELGHRLVSKTEAETSDVQRIDAHLDWKNLEFNVEGFERYEFNFKLESFETLAADKSLGTLELTVKESGRSFDQVQEKAQQKIRSFISEKIHELNTI